MKQHDLLEHLRSIETVDKSQGGISRSQVEDIVREIVKNLDL